MTPRLLVAVFISAVLAASGAYAACPPVEHSKTHATAKSRAQDNSCVDFDAVPQITANVVAAEPAASLPKASTYTPPTPPKYEGPTFGMTKPDPGVRPAPVVGYHWSLE